MGNIQDALEILQRIMEYKIASRDVLKSAIKEASDSDKPVLETFFKEQVETLARIPVIFKKLKFNAPRQDSDDSVTEMMDGLFIEVAAGGAGESLDFRKAALRIEEKAIQVMKKPLAGRSLSTELRSLVEESLLMAEIHANQLRKMVG